MKHFIPISEKVFESVVRSYQTGSKRERRPVKFVANTLGYSRQYYYKHRKLQSGRLAKEIAIKQLLDKERKLLPRLGGRKLYHQLSGILQRKGELQKKVEALKKES